MLLPSDIHILEAFVSVRYFFVDDNIGTLVVQDELAAFAFIPI